MTLKPMSFAEEQAWMILVNERDAYYEMKSFLGMNTESIQAHMHRLDKKFVLPNLDDATKDADVDYIMIWLHAMDNSDLLRKVVNKPRFSKYFKTTPVQPVTANDVNLSTEQFFLDMEKARMQMQKLTGADHIVPKGAIDPDIFMSAATQTGRFYNPCKHITDPVCASLKIQDTNMNPTSAPMPYDPSTPVVIKTVTFVNNVDIEDKTFDSLLSDIVTIEARIAVLKDVKADSSAIKKQIATLETTRSQVVTLLDAKK